MKPFTCLALAAVLLAVPVAVHAQMPASPNGTEAQRAAMARLSAMDGEWRGTATIHGPHGTETLTQTERVGPMLGGSIKVVEGRGYAADGSTEFNAMAVLSWDARAARYGFRSYAQGFSGDYTFEATDDGFRWETPAGPGAKIEYVAVIRDGTWHEVGTFIAEGQPPRQMIEMRLTRIGEASWPAAGAVDPVP